MPLSYNFHDFFLRNRDSQISHGESRFKWYEKIDSNGDLKIGCGTPLNPEYSDPRPAHSDLTACRLAACQIERKFAEELVEIGFQELYNPSYKGMVGRGECSKNVTTAKNNPGRFDLEDKNDMFYNCCGAYPNRFPFMDGGVRVCCGDGKVRNEGTC